MRQEIIIDISNNSNYEIQKWYYGNFNGNIIVSSLKDVKNNIINPIIVKVDKLNYMYKEDKDTLLKQLITEEIKKIQTIKNEFYITNKL